MKQNGVGCTWSWYNSRRGFLDALRLGTIELRCERLMAGLSLRADLEEGREDQRK